MPQAPAVPTPPPLATREFIARAATRMERTWCMVRAVFVATNLVRTLWALDYLGVATPLRHVLSLAIATVSLSFYGYVLAAFRMRPVPDRLLWLSIGLDILLATVALGTNPFYPGPGYEGLVRMPDLGILMILIVAGGLRISTGAAAFGAATGCAAFASLVALDIQVAGVAVDTILEHLVFASILFLSASFLGIVIASRTRSLVLEGALHTIQAERAERNLGSLLQDHHDVRTQLSSASLNAGLLASALNGERPALAGELPGLAHDLRDDLRDVNDLISGIKERTHGELAALQVLAPVNVGKVARSLSGDVASRPGAPRLRVLPECDSIDVWLPAGEPTLRRILRNLVVNAAEGDGTKGASSVELRAQLDSEEWVRLYVCDDGPGFTDGALTAPIGSRTTTKAEGSGLGLVLVETLLGPNAPTLRRENRAGGGAQVSFELPLVRAPH